MRLIDADALVERTEAIEDVFVTNWTTEKVQRLIHDAPTIDAVPVVRCGECKWYEPCTDCGFDEVTGRRDHSKIVEKPYGECHGQDFHFTEDGCLRVGVDDFCSYGERRSE